MTDSQCRAYFFYDVQNVGKSTTDFGSVDDLLNEPFPQSRISGTSRASSDDAAVKGDR